MTQKEIFKRDNLVVDLLFKHMGEENALPHTDIEKHLENHGYKIGHDRLRNILSRIRQERKLPIVYSRGKGYFWAKRKSEIEQTLNDLKSMQQSLQDQIDVLSKFVME